MAWQSNSLQLYGNKLQSSVINNIAGRRDMVVVSSDSGLVIHSLRYVSSCHVMVCHQAVSHDQMMLAHRDAACL